MHKSMLEEGLDNLRRRAISTGAGRAIAWGVIVAIAIVIAAMWMDLIVELPGGVRLACDIVAFVVAVALAGWVLQQVVRASRPHAMALKVDRIAGAGGQILSGVDLSLSPSSSAGTMTAGLSQLAVDRAAQLLRSVPRTAVASIHDLRKPLLIIGLAALSVAIFSIVSTRLVATQWVRFFDPFGDHPPYTSLSFQVEPGNTSVIYGGSVDISVQTQGPVTERIDLIVLDGQTQLDPLPMFPERDGKWRATIVNVVSPYQFFVRSGRARTQRYQIGVITLPKIESVLFRITPPSYTNIPSYEGPLPQGGLIGLLGTKVHLVIKSNRPLASGTLTFSPTVAPGAPPSIQPATTLNLAPASSGSNEVAGDFEIQTPGRLTLGVTDVEQQVSTENFTALVSVLRDDKPFVRLTEPKANSFATPDAIVQIVAMAEDDFGISAVSVYRGLNETRPRPMTIEVPTPAPRQLPATLSMPLSDYALQPGDVVKLFARVQDNDPAGAKGSESSVVTLNIISQDEMNRMLLAREGLEVLQSKYAQAARNLEKMADEVDKAKDELSKLDPNSELAKEKQKELSDLAEQLEKAADDVEKLAQHDLPIDLDKALTEHLEKMAATLRDAAKEVKEAGKPGMSVSGAGEKLAEASKKLGRERKDFKENVEEPMEHLLKIFPLLEDQARYLELAARQRDLAQRLSSLEPGKAQNDPATKVRMRELQEQQQQAQRDLEKLLDDIDDHVTQLPEDPRVDDLRTTATRFSKAVRASAAASQMQQAQTALDEFAGGRAANAAAEASKTLDSFIGECNSMGQEGTACLKFQPKLAKGLGNSVEQLLGEMGLGTGPAGGGSGGYSVSRSSLQNVGLYGTLPMKGEQSSASGNGDADRGAGTNSDGDPDRLANPDGTGNAGETQASGEGDAAVPLEYKKRVGDYFRRVADELEK